MSAREGTFAVGDNQEVGGEKKSDTNEVFYALNSLSEKKKKICSVVVSG
jgi:hypothetical protein